MEELKILCEYCKKDLTELDWYKTKGKYYCTLEHLEKDENNKKN